MSEESATRPVSKGKLLSAENVSITSPSGRPIVKDLSFGIGPGGRLAIIGVEGVGKSTLIKALAHQSLDGFAISGELSAPRVGYLPQSLDGGWLTRSVMEFLCNQTPEHELQPSAWDNYTELNRALRQVDLSDRLLERSMGALSGGEQVRVQLAKLLFEQHDVFVLDEPTNYLDLWTVKWLQEFLQSFSGPMCFVSHDELLLSSVATSVCYLQYVSYRNEARHLLLNTTYERFLVSRGVESEKQAKFFEAQQRRLGAVARRLTDMKNRAVSRSARSKPADAMEKGRARRGQANAIAQIAQLAKRIEIEERVSAPIEDAAIKLDFPLDFRIPDRKTVVSLVLHELRAGEVLLAGPIELTMTGPEKVVIVGRNGSGKSTLLRHIHEDVQANAKVTAHFVAQKTEDMFPDERESPIAFLKRYSTNESLNRTLMARMQFEDFEADSPISSLSGGQKVKLTLISAMLKEAGLLILDEPTSNLSPLSLPALREALAEFPGALLIVTHDRMLIDEVADRVLQLDESGLGEIDKEQVIEG